ncbi:hypothetical protein GGI05_000557 [Coemansia sp. RSA 2603]|nr:hypothetical protein GGI05_000557 [Coemansia sp. RSA 2603]
MNGRPSFETLGSNTDVTSLVNLAYEVDGLTISTEANFARVADDINEKIDVLTKNVQQIERLHSDAIYSTSPFKHTQMLRSRKQYANDTESVIATIRANLQVLAHAASDPHIFKSDRAIRSNRLVALARKYHDQIDTYRRMEREQASRNRDRLVQLYRLACPEASDDDIFAAIDNIRAREAMERKVMESCTPGEARKVIKDVNDRIGDIANIEHTVSELTKYHIEITDMINSEQAKLDTITVSVERIQTRVSTRLTDKNYSISSRTTTSKRKRWTIIIAVLLLVIGSTLGITLGVLRAKGTI